LRATNLAICGRFPTSRFRGTQVTLARTLNQQQAVAELPIAGIGGETVWAKDSRNKLPHPRRGFWIRPPSPAARVLPRVPVKGYMSPTASAPQCETHYTTVQSRDRRPAQATSPVPKQMLNEGLREPLKSFSWTTPGTPDGIRGRSPGRALTVHVPGLSLDG
jgi:hypothetical protein